MRAGLIASCLAIALSAVAVPLSLVWATPACADSWGPPEATTYFSPDKTCRLTIAPRDLTSQLDYFEDKLKDKNKAGQRGNGNTAPRATLDRLGTDGKWQRVWSRELVNDVAPVDALVGKDMHHVVTLDNWASMGYGDDTIVIYDLTTGNVRSLSLAKLLGADFFDALPHSVSSVWWRDGARIENGSLVLRVVAPGEEPFQPGKRLELAIDLASGIPAQRGAAAWRDARIAAAGVKAAERERIEELRIFRAAPLLGPHPEDVRGWHRYLEEAYRRLDPNWIEGYPRMTILPSKAAPNYRNAADWIGEALAEVDREGTMFAGVDEADLLTTLEAAVTKLSRREIRGARIYVAASEAGRPQLERIFAPFGAKLILLDPAKPISQRPQRMPRADGSLPYRGDFERP